MHKHLLVLQLEFLAQKIVGMAKVLHDVGLLVVVDEYVLVIGRRHAQAVNGEHAVVPDAENSVYPLLAQEPLERRQIINYSAQVQPVGDTRHVDALTVGQPHKVLGMHRTSYSSARPTIYKRYCGSPKYCSLTLCTMSIRLAFGLFVCALAVVGGGSAARILAVFPTPAYSHHSVFRVYVRALAERGHDVVVIKPTERISYTDDNDDTVGNITEIDATLSQEYFQQLFKHASVFRKRGLVADSSTVTAHNYMGLVRMMSDQFELPAVKQFIAQKQRFDLLVTEAFMDYPLIFSHLFGHLPVIQISSGYAIAENFETMGAVSRHPVYYPNLWRDKFSDLNVWQMINEIYVEMRLQNEFSQLADEQTRLMKQQFGMSAPSVHELRDRVELLFVNTHPVFDNNRPVPPSVQYLGGLHLVHKTHKPLFGTIRQFLDNCTQGAVYVSFGSGISSDDMEAEFVEMLLRAFEQLPYGVLWKHEGFVPRLPPNVFMQSWFDQFDLLHHPHLRAFVTQGGVQSTDEAIDALVPLVGMPMMGDQAFNANKYTELGIGLVVDTISVTSNQLVDAITEAVENSKYRKRLTALRHLINHQPITPLHKAVWYTEHVIANRNTTTMLRTKAANVNYSDYVMSYIFVPFVTFSVMNHLRQLLRINVL
ncbi:egt [Peridroma alphabaculovirus]|uniref:Ecdysteroid UDP-glucosyltransferase n=1 Tax=Peridroma alphabaculovirus TaxID=1346829 RepID=A0A068LK58_9ABAC|nr:egt [Peridroma alphabaculovirus]AIE47754.1 egt [Peridroma alphabaculovirus]